MSDRALDRVFDRLVFYGVNEAAYKFQDCWLVNAAAMVWSGEAEDDEWTLVIETLDDTKQVVFLTPMDDQPYIDDQGQLTDGE